MNTNHFEVSFKIPASLINIHDDNFTKQLQNYARGGMEIYSCASGRGRKFLSLPNGRFKFNTNIS